MGYLGKHIQVSKQKKKYELEYFYGIDDVFSVNEFTSEYVTNSGLLTPELIDVLNIRKRG